MVVKECLYGQDEKDALKILEQQLEAGQRGHNEVVAELKKRNEDNLEPFKGSQLSSSLLPGFSNSIQELRDPTMRDKISGTRKDRAEAIHAVAKNKFWVLQAFLSYRLRNRDMVLKTEVNDDIDQIASLEDPYTCPDAIKCSISVTEPAKMVEAYKEFCKLRQVQMVKIIPEMNATTRLVRFYFVLCQVLICELEIRLSTHTINAGPNSFFSKLASCDDASELQDLI